MKALLLQLAIAFFTPFVTALYKTIAVKVNEAIPAIVGKLPPNTIPLFNAGIGGVSEILAPMLGGPEIPSGTGILAGLAAGGLRDMIMKKGRK